MLVVVPTRAQARRAAGDLAVDLLGRVRAISLSPTGYPIAVLSKACNSRVTLVGGHRAICVPTSSDATSSAIIRTAPMAGRPPPVNHVRMRAEFECSLRAHQFLPFNLSPQIPWFRFLQVSLSPYGVLPG